MYLKGVAIAVRGSLIAMLIFCAALVSTLIGYKRTLLVQAHNKIYRVNNHN